MTSDMRPLFEGIRLVGTAVTVKTLAADLAAAFKAIDVCEPGDIVVIDSHGSVDTAFWGENMTMSALNRGVVAAVIMVRVGTSRKSGRSRFPVICKGVVPNVGAIAGYGHVNVAIQCAGVSVLPGDIIVVDGNGVVVVPMEEAVVDSAEGAAAYWRRSVSCRRKSKLARPSASLLTSTRFFRTAFSYQNKALEHG